MADGWCLLPTIHQSRVARSSPWSWFFSNRCITLVNKCYKPWHVPPHEIEHKDCDSNIFSAADWPIFSIKLVLFPQLAFSIRHVCVWLTHAQCGCDSTGTVTISDGNIAKIIFSFIFFLFTRFSKKKYSLSITLPILVNLPELVLTGLIWINELLSLFTTHVYHSIYS